MKSRIEGVNRGYKTEYRPVPRPSPLDRVENERYPDDEREKRRQNIKENIEHLGAEMEAGKRAHDILSYDTKEVAKSPESQEFPEKQEVYDRHAHKKHLFPNQGKGGSIDIYG